MSQDVNTPRSSSCVTDDSGTPIRYDYYGSDSETQPNYDCTDTPSPYSFDSSPLILSSRGSYFGPLDSKPPLPALVLPHGGPAVITTSDHVHGSLLRRQRADSVITSQSQAGPESPKVESQEGKPPSEHATQQEGHLRDQHNVEAPRNASLVPEKIDTERLLLHRQRADSVNTYQSHVAPKSSKDKSRGGKPSPAHAPQQKRQLKDQQGLEAPEESEEDDDFETGRH